jgi:hypothetical protein
MTMNFCSGEKKDGRKEGTNAKERMTREREESGAGGS